MKFVLFIGSKVGFEALQIMIQNKCEIVQVFIEEEHTHEHEKFYEYSSSLCRKHKIIYKVNASQLEINNSMSALSGMNSSIDYIMSFGYRRMISEKVVQMAKIAALGTHFSPLPRYRGFAPLNWVLANGEKETAVNIFFLSQEVDDGDIVDSEQVLIDYEDNINTLYEKCILNFRIVMNRTIPKLKKGIFESYKQDRMQATYTCARNPEDGVINWNLTSREIYNLVRSLSYPFPGAFTFLNGCKLLIWSCEEYVIPKYEGIIPGKVIKIIKGQGVVVMCKEGAILLKSIQLEEEKCQPAEKYLSSIRLTLGR